MKTELKASGIQLAAASLGDVGDGFEEQVGAVLSLADSERLRWLQQNNCSFYNASFPFRLWLTHQVSLSCWSWCAWVFANQLRGLVLSFSSMWHCTTQRHFTELGMQALDEGTKCQPSVRQKDCSKWCARAAFLANTNQAMLGHHPSHPLGSKRLGTVTALLLPPGNAACWTLDHHLLRGCFLLLCSVINYSFVMSCNDCLAHYEFIWG